MWQSGVRSCITPGLHTHLVQELNVSTVVRKSIWLSSAVQCLGLGPPCGSMSLRAGDKNGYCRLLVIYTAAGLVYRDVSLCSVPHCAGYLTNVPIILLAKEWKTRYLMKCTEQDFLKYSSHELLLYR